MPFTLLRRLWIALTPCQHVDAEGKNIMYRERRSLQGVDVMHFVCPRCSRAVPVLTRTAEEQAKPVVAPSHERLKARKAMPTPIVKFGRKSS